MSEVIKEYSDENLLLTEIKKMPKTKEKNTKCKEYAIKKFQENRGNNK